MSEALEKAREAAKAKRIAMQEAGETAVTLDPQQRFEANPTRGNAINAFCYQCMGAQSGYTKMIRECTSPKCSLFNFRPYK